jgi:calcium permeable stress-gated cation channel
MAIKFLAVVVFFSWTVIYPVYQAYGNEEVEVDEVNNKEYQGHIALALRRRKELDPWPFMDPKTGYLWIYVVFVYFFSLLAIYLIVTETKKVIGIRQKYLSVRSSITDRTIRLSGIPRHLRSEEKIKETIENLEIGKVESVTLCRNWEKLDQMMDKRLIVLRKLEEAWTVHLGYQVSSRNIPPKFQTVENGSEDGEDNVNTPLLEDGAIGQSHVTAYDRARPKTRIWHGWFRSELVDSIDYYEEKLHQIDQEIIELREKEYEPTPLAFVTLDSIAACQMATQAILDPEPMQLIANPAPAPADVVWPNTYISRRSRMIRAWSITAFILLLTILWLSILFPIAILLNLKTIGKFLPQFADFLEEHETLQSLVRTSLPTIGMTALNSLVPFLYDWLSNLQGMTSKGDVEMSVISKNFFFTFFNLFVAFTLIGTASTAYSLWGLLDRLRDRFNDFYGTTLFLAESLKALGLFYMNLILLQGVGLFPFRLLEFGSVFLYPITLIGAKTPRDYAELVQPPVFSYGFYLPQTLFVFSICIVYSALPSSQFVAVFGFVYFVLGHFVYKYQLLYAMDHRHFSTGRAWPMICIRIVVALIFFQVAMAGQLILKGAIPRSVLVVPLFIGTIWFAFWYNRTFEPLMRFIALRSLHEAQDEAQSLNESRLQESMSITRCSVDDDESNWKYINPNLIIPLEDIWIAKTSSREAQEEGLAPE